MRVADTIITGFVYYLEVVRRDNNAQHTCTYPRPGTHARTELDFRKDAELSFASVYFIPSSLLSSDTFLRSAAVHVSKSGDSFPSFDLAARLRGH